MTYREVLAIQAQTSSEHPLHEFVMYGKSKWWLRRDHDNNKGKKSDTDIPKVENPSFYWLWGQQVISQACLQVF